MTLRIAGGSSCLTPEGFVPLPSVSLYVSLLSIIGTGQGEDVLIQQQSTPPESPCLSLESISVL